MMYNSNMHRTQVLLKKCQYEALKARARRTDKSLSELIRLAIDRLFGWGESAKAATDLSDICGIGKDPKGPSGRDHDKALYNWTK